MSTILLVDDDESNRLTVSALLEDDGYEVRTAASSRDARNVLSDVKHADLILLDQHLGDGIGSDLVALIRALHPRARIILMSGSVGAEGLPETADACFEKGGPFQDLLGLIHDLLGEQALPARRPS